MRPAIWLCLVVLSMLGCDRKQEHRDAGIKNDRDAAPDAARPDATHLNIHRLDGGEHAAGLDEGLTSEFMQDAGDGWKSLVQAHWIVPSNTEQYRCARLTVPHDVALRGFRALSPIGTHHTLLTVTPNPTEPDGLTVCDVATNAQGMLVASGVGMNDYSLPAGVAVKLHAGEQLLLNLHLFNVTDEPIEGTSGTLVQIAEADQIEHEAESVLAGSISFSIPPHSKDFLQSGTCTMVQDETLVAVGGHAHMHATHIKVTAHSSIEGDVVLSDRDFSFDASRLYGLDPLVRMKKGDQVQIDCTFDNDGDTPIMFGDSSLDEMCFAGIFRYPPAKNPQYLCAQ